MSLASNLRQMLRYMRQLVRQRSFFKQTSLQLVHEQPIRTEVTIAIASIIGIVADVLRMGTYSVTRAKVAKFLHPTIVYDLTCDKRCVIVSGTVGVTTTVSMMASAMRSIGSVAYTTSEENNELGAIEALLANRRASFAFIGVNENECAEAAERLKADVFVLTNLTRGEETDDADMAEIHNGIRRLIRLHPRMTVIANCDNPMVVYAVAKARRIIWVNAGCSWKRETVTLPGIETPVTFKGNTWFVPGTELKRPEPRWSLDKHTLLNRQTGESYGLPQHLSAGFYVLLAGFTTITAQLMGIDIDHAVTDLQRMEPYLGQNAKGAYGPMTVRMTRMRTPQSLEQAFDMLSPRATDLVMLFCSTVSTNDEVSWVWDTDLSIIATALQGKNKKIKHILLTGDRAEELALCLTYWNIPVVVEPDLVKAAQLCRPDGYVEVLSNDTGYAQGMQVYERLTSTDQTRNKLMAMMRNLHRDSLSLRPVTKAAIKLFSLFTRSK